MRDYDFGFQNGFVGEDHSYFKKSGGDAIRFLNEYLPLYENSRQDGLFCFITGNHDTMRPRASLTPDELKLAYAFLFTMPGVPFIYYGDEIGMRYLNLPTKEGGYYRTGSRTPMQWSRNENLGFSTAKASELYLPVDGAADAPTVSEQENDPESLLNTVRRLLKLRHETPDLQADGSFEVLSAEKGSRLFAYHRGTIIVAVNPGGEAVRLPLKAESRLLFQLGSCRLEKEFLLLEGQSFAVLQA